MGTGPTEIYEDEPHPEVGEVQQRELVLPAVLVRPDGPVTVQQLPARTAPPMTFVLSTAVQHVLGADLKRRRAILLADQDWLFSRTQSGTSVFWPAKVPLYLESCDSVYAKVATSTANLSVIPEVWAD